MIFVAVNHAGEYFEKIERGILIFNKDPVFATEFVSDAICLRDQAFRPLFDAIESKTVAWVPHPQMRFSHITGGVSVYVTTATCLRQNHLNLSLIPAWWQRDFLGHLYAAHALVDAEACKVSRRIDPDLRKRLDGLTEDLNGLILRAHYDLELLENDDGSVAKQPGKFGATLFPPESDDDDEDFTLQV